MGGMRAAPALLALAVAGCGGGARVYPSTDVAELKEFGNPRTAAGVQIDRGTMQNGTLEYASQGDLVAVFRAYIAAMRDLGWQPRSEDIGGEKATAALIKDTRICSLLFTQAEGKVRAVIKVGPAK